MFNAQFGPGASNAPRAQMRDMDVADLDGDGKKEIVVGTWEGLVVALSNECQKVWSTRMPSPPTSIECVAPRGAKLPWVVVGCDDGTVGGAGSTGPDYPARQGDRPAAADRDSRYAGRANGRAGNRQG